MKSSQRPWLWSRQSSNSEHVLPIALVDSTMILKIEQLHALHHALNCYVNFITPLTS